MKKYCYFFTILTAAISFQIARGLCLASIHCITLKGQNHAFYIFFTFTLQYLPKTTENLIMNNKHGKQKIQIECSIYILSRPLAVKV